MGEKMITIGDKEYSRSELLEFGKRHYPKFYWIYRGIGIGLMFIGVLVATIYLGVGLAFSKEFDNEFAIVYYCVTIPFGIIAAVGAILFGISFKKRPDEDYIKHATDYYKKVAANNKAREERIRAREEKVSQNQEDRDITQLLKYKQLLDAGIITQEEFDKKKQELLGND